MLMQQTVCTYPRHLEVPQHTPSLPSFYTTITDLCGPCVAVHLAQFELGLGARSCWEAQIANDIS